MTKIKETNIEINNQSYNLRCQFRDISKLEEHGNKAIEKDRAICILKHKDMWRLYCSIRKVKNEMI